MWLRYASVVFICLMLVLLMITMPVLRCFYYSYHYMLPLSC